MIDFHCHLDLYPDPVAIAKECFERGEYILSLTTTPSAWEGTSALARYSPRIRTSLGLHPQIAHERKAEMPLFEKILPQVKYVGEIGLDGGPEYKPHWDTQVAVFTAIVELCTAAGGRICSIHSRRAATPVLDILDENRGIGIPILHWFSGTQRELDRAVEIGCWFSVGPAMLRGEKGRALALRIPRDRILTETDGPFAQVDGRPLLPWDVSQATDAISELWETTPEIVNVQLLSNLRTLGSLQLPSE